MAPIPPCPGHEDTQAVEEAVVVEDGQSEVMEIDPAALSTEATVRATV